MKVLNSWAWKANVRGEEWGGRGGAGSTFSRDLKIKVAHFPALAVLVGMSPQNIGI
jgi:hypothetical protein